MNVCLDCDRIACGVCQAPTTELTVTIPEAWWLNANHRHHWTKRKTATANLRALAVAEAQKQRVTKGHERVRIVAHITYPTAGINDPNNAAPTTKALVDGLVDYGLVPDDNHRHVTGPDHRYAGVTKGQRTIRLVIEPLENGGA